MQRVVSEHCPLCGGRKQPGKTTYSVDLGSGVVLVRNVEKRGLTTTPPRSWNSSPRKPGRRACKSKSWLFEV